MLSRPIRARGLKLASVHDYRQCEGRAPYGRVDGNWHLGRILGNALVTPHS